MMRRGGDRHTLLSLKGICSQRRRVQQKGSVGPLRNSSDELMRERKKGVLGVGSSSVLQ